MNWGIIPRQPDRVINSSYLHRWHILPRNRWCNIYLHRFVGDDDDRALHDHPWWSVSFLLKGAMLEHTLGLVSLWSSASCYAHGAVAAPGGSCRQTCPPSGDPHAHSVDAIYHRPKNPHMGIPLPKRLGALASVHR